MSLALTMQTSPSSLRLPTTFQHYWNLCQSYQVLRWWFAWIRCPWMLLQSWKNGARLMVLFSWSLLNVRFSSFVIYYILKFCATVESYGKANLIEPIPAYQNLIASICYTSVCLLYLSFREQPATPKVSLHIFYCPKSYWHPIGVVLTHKYLAVSVHSQLYGMGLPENPILISYLPLAHIYGVSMMKFSLHIDIDNSS